MKQYYKIDNDGLYIEPVIGNLQEENCIEKKWDKSLYKPKWNGFKWVEGATEEYMKEMEENKVVQNPSENEMLISNLLLDNAELKNKTAELEELTSTLMLQIAELKGGNTNV